MRGYHMKTLSVSPVRRDSFLIDDGEKYRTDNNVPISKYILDIFEDIDHSVNYSYPNTPTIYSLLEELDILHTIKNTILGSGVDGIIKDLFCLFSGKNVYYDLPNYGMVDVYSKSFRCNRVDELQSADLVYMSIPNPSCDVYTNFDELVSIIKNNKNITFVVDYSYEMYNSSQLYKFFDKVHNLINNYNVIVLYGTSKMLGLPSIKMGIGVTNNFQLFRLLRSIMQPHPISSFGINVMEEVLNYNTINKHIQIINISKMKIKKMYRDIIIGDTFGPYVFLMDDVGGCKKIDNYYRLTVIDEELIK